MSALELAEMLEHEPDISEGDQMSVALMLRAQHAAIRQLREALIDIAGRERESALIVKIAYEALAATEGTV
jgi:hypothetical protein